MNYEIYCDGKLIAKFTHPRERDECLAFLQDKFGKSLGCKYEAKDEKDSIFKHILLNAQKSG